MSCDHLDVEQSELRARAKSSGRAGVDHGKRPTYYRRLIGADRPCPDAWTPSTVFLGQLGCAVSIVVDKPQA
jgi:hypothetical protein